MLNIEDLKGLKRSLCILLVEFLVLFLGIILPPFFPQLPTVPITEIYRRLFLAWFILAMAPLWTSSRSLKKLDAILHAQERQEQYYADNGVVLYLMELEAVKERKEPFRALNYLLIIMLSATLLPSYFPQLLEDSADIQSNRFNFLTVMSFALVFSCFRDIAKLNELLEEKKAMNIQITAVDEGSRDAVCALRVKATQAQFIETVEDCLREADEFSLWRPVGVYDGTLLIGFAMYGLWLDGDTGERVWLDRFLLDASCQGQGYAVPALQALIARITGEYDGVERLYLSLYENNAHALSIYKKLGFQFNGELDINGEKVMVLRLGA